MKRLYAIAEEHFKLSPKDARILWKSNPGNPLAERIYSTSLRRIQKIQRFVETYKPEVFFYEGPPRDLELNMIGYKGKKVSLHEGGRYHTLQERYGEISVITLKDIYNEVFGCSFSKERIIKVLIKREEMRGTPFVQKFESGYQIKKEVRWTEKIIEDYEEPSALICGVGHLCDGIEVLRLTPSFISYLGFLSTIQKRKEGKHAILRGLLKHEKIYLEVKEVLRSSFR